MGYIGETKRELRLRIGEHRGSITRKLKNSIGRHFNKCHGKKPEAFLRVVGIEKVRPEKNDQLRKIRESQMDQPLSFNKIWGKQKRLRNLNFLEIN